ncbi:MAG: inositol monophosphatase, partial [Planctomycetota bacterium]
SLARRLAFESSEFTKQACDAAFVNRKCDNTVVTSIDHAIQAHIISAIASQYPDHAVIAEEQVSEFHLQNDPRLARFCWVIDPLDGTRNYVAGFPCFATSIAVLDRGIPVVGVIFEHNLALEFYASSSGGAFQSRDPGAAQERSDASCIRRLLVIEPDPNSDSLIGVPSTKDPTSIAILQQWAATKGLILRNLGSTATHLALVTSGALSAAYCYQCKIWDIAAGVLLVSEAGGLITDLQGQPIERFDLTLSPSTDLPYLAGAPQIHMKLFKVSLLP